MDTLPKFDKSRHEDGLRILLEIEFGHLFKEGKRPKIKFDDEGSKKIYNGNSKNYNREYYLSHRGKDVKKRR